MMKRFIFILGGARSGKSRYAVELAKGLSHKVAYIATCANPDAEMKKRIALHKHSRPRYWKVIEAAKDISPVLNNLKSKYKVAIIDCLGLWISNLLTEDLRDREIEREISKLIKSISKLKVITILVSNEVGAGIVPDNPLARRFRDLLGMTNQMMAREADDVIFMHSGIPLTLKEGKENAKNK